MARPGAVAKILGVIPEFLRAREMTDDLPRQELVLTRDLLDRKRIMIEAADAFVALPGGYGTVDEVVEVLSMAALGLDVGPLVLIDVAGDWDPFLSMVEGLSDRGFVRRTGLCHVVGRAAEALDLVEALAAPVVPQARRATACRCAERLSLNWPCAERRWRSQLLAWASGCAASKDQRQALRGPPPDASRHGTLDLVGGRWWLWALAGAGALAFFALPEGWARQRSAGRIRTVAEVPAAEVGLVLGAGVRSDGKPSRILQGRLTIALDLLRAGKVRRIVVSGSPHSRGYSEPVVMRDYLVAHGVAPSDVQLDESGVDTWHSARAAAERLGLRAVTIITTAFHLRRSIALFRSFGIDAYGVGHDAAADGLRRVSARGARREVLATVKAFWWPR